MQMPRLRLLREYRTMRRAAGAPIRLTHTGKTGPYRCTRLRTAKTTMTTKVIITGGPGSGKTTLIEQLARLGYGTSPEVSRRLIREQAALECGVLPWQDLPAFAALALDAMLREHDAAEARAELVFFDRGIPDIFGYLHNAGIDVPAAWHATHGRCRYHRTVFLLPPWDEIYVNDAERPQRFSESVRLHGAIESAYRALGYELVEVPRLPCEERAAFVLSQVP
jgi:predicted ATPase